MLNSFSFQAAVLLILAGEVVLYNPPAGKDEAIGLVGGAALVSVGLVLLWFAVKDWLRLKAQGRYWRLRD